MIADEVLVLTPKRIRSWLASHGVEGSCAVQQERRASVDAQSQRVADVRVRAAQARQRAESDRQALDRLERSIQELGERGERLKTDVERGAKQQGETLGAGFVAVGVGFPGIVEARARSSEPRLSVDDTLRIRSQRRKQLLDLVYVSGETR